MTECKFLSIVPDSPQNVQVLTETPQSVRITWQPHPGFSGRVTRYMVKWLHIGKPADSNMDGHKIVNAGTLYERDSQVGGLKPYNMYSFMVREEVGQNNWSKFSAPVDVIMPEDGMPAGGGGAMSSYNNLLDEGKGTFRL